MEMSFIYDFVKNYDVVTTVLYRSAGFGTTSSNDGWRKSEKKKEDGKKINVEYQSRQDTEW